MTEIKAEIEDGKVRAAFKALGSGAFLKPAGQRIGLKLTTDLKRYPAEPAGSTYRRTGLLGRRWTFQVSAGLFGVAVTAGNNTIYGVWVQSAAQQAQVDAGRWQTDEEVLDNNIAYIEKEVGEAVEEQIKRATT